MKKAAIWLCFLLILAPAVPAGAAEGLTCWFPPDWTDMDRAHEITDALSQGSGYMVQPRRADSYPQILESITSGFPCLVYAGSFVQSVITFRQLAEPLVQAIDGRELYGCTMIFRHGDDSDAILAEHGDQVAYAQGASSGEVCAKAATDGRAWIGLADHRRVADAVAGGRARAGFVKNWWWNDHLSDYKDLVAISIDGISDRKHADNVLAAANTLAREVHKRVAVAALDHPGAFGAKRVVQVNPRIFEFSIRMMQKGKIDPYTYQWD